MVLELVGVPKLQNKLICPNPLKLRVGKRGLVQSYMLRTKLRPKTCTSVM